MTIVSGSSDCSTRLPSGKPAFPALARAGNGYRARQLRLELQAYIGHMGAPGMAQMTAQDPLTAPQPDHSVL